MWRDKWETEKNLFKPRTRLSWNEFIDTLPDTLPDPIDLSIVGGLTQNGFTENDIDFVMVGNWNDVKMYSMPLNEMTNELFSKSSSIKNWVVDARPSNVVVQLYDNGNLNNREELKSQVTEKEEKVKMVRGTMKEIIERLEKLENGV